MACLTEAVKETAKNICKCMYYNQIHGSLCMCEPCWRSGSGIDDGAGLPYVSLT